MRWGILVMGAVALGCGGETGQDDPVRTILPPLSVECVQHEDCLPASFGYATCRENRCTFRCDSIEAECTERGGTCEDQGAGNWFCVVR